MQSGRPRSRRARCSCRAGDAGRRGPPCLPAARACCAAPDAAQPNQMPPVRGGMCAWTSRCPGALPAPRSHTLRPALPPRSLDEDETPAMYQPLKAHAQ